MANNLGAYLHPPKGQPKMAMTVSGKSPAVRLGVPMNPKDSPLPGKMPMPKARGSRLPRTSNDPARKGVSLAASTMVSRPLGAMMSDLPRPGGMGLSAILGVNKSKKNAGY